MLLLPALKDIAKQQQTTSQAHGLSFAAISSSSLIFPIDSYKPTTSIMGGRCTRASKKEIEALKTAHSITLQEVIDAISSCCSGEAPETEALLMERFLGRAARVFDPSSLLTDENVHIRRSLESLGGVSLAPG